MKREGHPFAEVVDRMLGLSTPVSGRRMSESAIDFFLGIRGSFIDKAEGGQANSHVTLL